jgi:deoxyadenosine/deoxycytidine kinase
MTHIEIIAGVGAGKTSLGKALSSYEFSFIPEEFETNPFLSAFHQNPRSCAFEFGMTMLMMHYNRINSPITTPHRPVFDFSLVTNEAYARSYMAFNLLNPVPGETYIQTARQMRRESKKPEARIFLQLSPQTQIERIRQRGRELEREDRTTLAFLHTLKNHIEDITNQLDDGVPVIYLDAEYYNWAAHQGDKSTVANIINQALGR